MFKFLHMFSFQHYCVRLPSAALPKSDLLISGNRPEYRPWLTWKVLNKIHGERQTCLVEVVFFLKWIYTRILGWYQCLYHCGNRWYKSRFASSRIHDNPWHSITIHDHPNICCELPASTANLQVSKYHQVSPARMYAELIDAAEKQQQWESRSRRYDGVPGTGPVQQHDTPRINRFILFVFGWHFFVITIIHHKEHNYNNHWLCYYCCY